MRRLAPRVSLTTNALSLMTATVVTNGFGLVFWLVAAHLKSPAVVGRAVATIAALTLLATLGQLNLNNVFVRLLPVAGRLGRGLITRGYLVTILGALIAGVVYVVSGLGSGVLSDHWGAQALFTLAVPVLAIFTLQDSVLTALRLTRWVPVENVSFAVAKLALLPALVLLPTGGGLVLAWVLPAAVAVIVVSGLLFTRAIPRLDASEGSLPGRRQLLSFVGGEYASQIFATATVQLMPLLIVWRLGPVATAYFTLPWMVAMGITLLLWNVASAFVVEVLGGHGHSDAMLRRCLWLWGAISLTILAVCVLGARPLLSLAGARYAGHGVELLRLVGLSSPFSAVSTLLYTVLWLDRRVWLLAAFQAALSVALLGTTFALLPELGVNAVGWANLGVDAAAALVAGLVIIARMRAGRLVAGA